MRRPWSPSCRSGRHRSGSPTSPRRTATSALSHWAEEPCELLLIVEDPESTVAQAIAAGATEVYPVGEEHGWRLGGVLDPFGHHWEIGRPLIPWPPEHGRPGSR